VTISEPDSIGELIGPIAVLMTLVHLAIQVRLVRSEAKQSALIERFPNDTSGSTTPGF